MSIVTDVRVWLGGTATTFWSDAHVVDALNEVQFELQSEVKGAFWVVGTLTLTANDDLVMIPSNVMIPKAILGTAGKYFPTTQAKLEQECREWRGRTPGRPTHFVVWDAFTLRVYPRPDTTYLFEVEGVPWPTTELTTAVLDLTASEDWKRILALRAAAQLLEFTQPQLSDAYEREAQELLSDYKVSLRNRQGHNIRRLRPGTLFTRAQSGNLTVGRRFT